MVILPSVFDEQWGKNLGSSTDYGDGEIIHR